MTSQRSEIFVTLPVARRRSGEPAWKRYYLIPIRHGPNGYRGFFPGLDENFVLRTDMGSLEVWVTSASGDVQPGDRNAGNYICTPKKTQRMHPDLLGLSDWYNAHPELVPGDMLHIVYEEPFRYRLSIRHSVPQ